MNYHTTGPSKFNQTILKVAEYFTQKEHDEIKFMNETLDIAVHGRENIHYYDGDSEHMILNKTPEYKERLLRAYTLFKKYKDVFSTRQIQEADGVVCALLTDDNLYINRIIFVSLYERYMPFQYKIIKLSINEYLQKYSNDAIFYLEVLNKEYKDETNEFIPENVLSVKDNEETVAIREFEQEYTTLFSEVFAHTDATLLQPAPKKALMSRVADLIWTTSTTTADHPDLLNKGDFKDLFNKYRGDKGRTVNMSGRTMGTDRSLSTIIRMYKSELNKYKPSVIKEQGLALGVPRLVHELYVKAKKNITVIQTEFNKLKLYKENEESINRAHRGSGSKKYISRRKYKHTSIKTKHIRRF